MTALTLDLGTVNLTDEQYYQLCIRNENLRFERNANGDLVIMPPTGGETGNRNAGITAILWLWNEEKKLGKVFDSSTGFKLPNGADRSPDTAWIPIDRWDAIPSEKRKKILPLCPDFVVELMSPSDTRKDAREKMEEYLENGTKLGWLMNSKTKKIEIYRQNKEVEILENPSVLSGEDVLLEFVLRLARIW
ncbi:MAG: Uma2 family endonuclease [Cyanobacteria bacterium SBLK]|nr:Uma2 family endonuclease [Cyanobacteria bacterium SBLK]